MSAALGHQVALDCSSYDATCDGEQPSVISNNPVDLAVLAILSSQSPYMGRHILNACYSPPLGEPPQAALCKENSAADLQQHLRTIFALLEPHHLLKEVVKLETTHLGRIRYLAVLACAGVKETDEEETCILGYDCMADRTTLGLVSRLYADTHVILDGDGGFSLCTSGSQHVFKPVSVHTLWAVLQTLHKACSQAQRYNHFAGGTSHRWVDFYEQRIDSDRSCLNEWHLLPDVESRRPPSPDQMLKPRERAETERLIRSTLKEVMMVLDLDVVTSKDIRKKVEVDLGMDLTSFKSFIDEEMLTILGQMDGASYIFDHVYLGSEWNAANMEELQRNGVGHILNVTREIDNFFPGQFEYLNIRVYDDEATELLKHWDRTFKFISRALDAGSKVLVHCKMGVSRSASVVVAYAMKAYDWDLAKALHHVKMRRSCVKPNASFMEQLKIYAGILDASRQRHNKLWRSKSESNLKHEAHHDASVASATAAVPVSAPSTVACSSYVNSPSALVPLLPSVAVAASLTNASVQVGTDSVDSAGPTAASPVRPALSSADSPATQPTQSSMEVSVQVLDVSDANRPKSWSPDDSVVGTLFPPTPIATCEQSPDSESLQPGTNRSVGVSLRVPCGNGRTYSVSQNRCTLLNRASQLGSSPALASDDQENASTASWIRDEFWRTSESVDWMTSPSTELLDCINTALLLNGWHNADMENKASDDLSSLPRVGSVKDRIFEFETATSVQPANAYLWRPPVPVASSAVVHEQNPPLSQQQPPPCRLDRSGLVLNLASQFGTVASTTVSSSPEGDAETANPISGWSCGVPASDSEGPVVSQVKPAPLRHQAVLVRLTQDEKQPPPDCEERPVRSWTDSTNSETWNPLCSGSSLPCVGTADADLVLSSTDGLGSGWMTSYASDPTLPAAFLCDSARSLELAEVSSDVQSTSPPLGVVRMQLEALESQQRLPMAVAPRARRSLPDEFTKTATCLNRTADTTQPLNHGVSETAAGAGARTSVSRLRKELEAKAVLPLTGSVAPHPSVKAVVESSQAARTSPVRSSPPTPAFTTLRKRSLSVDKLNYRAIVFNRKGPTPESVESPPTSLARRTKVVPASSTATVSAVPTDGEIDVDLNVKLLVEQFETTQPERHRGLSESSGTNCSTTSSSSSCSSSSSSSTSSALRAAVAHSIMAKPPVGPFEAVAPVAAPRHSRKLHGKTHPLDRLAARQKHAQPVFGTM